MKNNSKEVVLDLELPGFSKKDLNIKIRKNKLEVKAERKQERKMQKKDFFHEERVYRGFSYFTSLPEIRPEKAKIKFSKGKLRIVLPRNKK